MRFNVLISFVATVFGFSAANTSAAEFFVLPGTSTLYMMGEITDRDLVAFQKFLADQDIDTLGVAGPGGSVQSALRIGEIIKARGIETLTIPDRDCASACSFVFMAGARRSMGDGSRIGVHLPFIDFDQASVSVRNYCQKISTQSFNERIMSGNFSVSGLDEDCLTATYQTAFDDAFILLNWIEDANVGQQVFRDMISTPPSRMMWYNKGDGVRLNLSTITLENSLKNYLNKQVK